VARAQASRFIEMYPMDTVQGIGSPYYENSGARNKC
jgi:hypothetical protein